MLHIAWAAQYNAWLLIKLTLKGVGFLFLHIGLVCLSQPMLLCLAVHCHHVKAASDPQPQLPWRVLSWCLQNQQQIHSHER